MLAAQVAVVLVAAALRLWRLGHGLPDVVPEDYPFRRGLMLWGWETGRVDWNPHFFIYPSLTIYLHFFLQKAAVAVGLVTGRYHVAADYRLAFASDPTPMLLLARGFQVACDLLTVIGVMRLADRLRPGTAVAAGLLVACSPVLIRTSQGVYCDTQLAALAVWALERMLAWRASGGRVRWISAIALTGLAAGAKYPGGLLVIPLAWVTVERCGRRALWLAPLAAIASLAVFLITSPFVVLDYPAFRRHFDYELEHSAAGHFGHVGQASFAPHARTLAANLGGVGVAALVAALVLAFAWRANQTHASRGASRVLWAFVLPLMVILAVARTPMERYLLPVIAVGAVLAVVAAFTLCDRVRTARAVALAAALAAILVPVGLGGAAAAFRGGRATQSEARAWCEAHVGAGDLMVREGYEARLLTRDAKQQVTGAPWFHAASAEAQRRYLARPTYHVVTIPLLTEGRPVVAFPTAQGGTVEIEIVPFAADLSRLFYDLRLFAATDYVLTSSAVRGRFEAVPERYAAELDWYRWLDREAGLVARFAPDRTTDGPEIRIYRLGPAARDTIAARFGALPPLWWAESIPISYRMAVERLRPAADPSNAGALRGSDGRVSPWVRSLESVYGRRISPFVLEMAREHAGLGRFEMAVRFATANLVMLPDDEESFRILAYSLFGSEPRPRAEAAVDSVLAGLERDDPRAAVLRGEYRRILEIARRP